MLAHPWRAVPPRPRFPRMLGFVLGVILAGVLAQAANAHLYTGIR